MKKLRYAQYAHYLLAEVEARLKTLATFEKKLLTEKEKRGLQAVQSYILDEYLPLTQDTSIEAGPLSCFLKLLTIQTKILDCSALLYYNYAEYDNWFPKYRQRKINNLIHDQDL